MKNWRPRCSNVGSTLEGILGDKSCMFLLSTISAGEAGPSSTGLLVSLVMADGEEVHDAELDVADAAELAEGGDVAVPHCACAF